MCENLQVVLQLRFDHDQTHVPWQDSFVMLALVQRLRSRKGLSICLFSCALFSSGT